MNKYTKENKYNIIVLMSSYNGEKYIEKQIRTIMNQEKVHTQLLIRDDGSADDTINIVKELSCEYSDRIKLLIGENKGFVQSFSELVNIAVNMYPQYQYYAFVDQDDVWYDNNMLTKCDVLDNMDNTLPCLVSSNSKYCDKDEIELGLFHTYIPLYTRANVLIESTEQGCSMVFNRKALEIYNNNNPVHCWHDRWMFYICFYLGQFQYIEKPLFLYRIHGENALGEIKKTPSLIYRIKEHIRYINPNKKNSKHWLFVKEFYEQFEDKISEKDKKFMLCYINYRSSIKSKLIMICSSDFCSSKPSIRFQEQFKRHILLGLV